MHRVPRRSALVLSSLCLVGFSACTSGDSEDVPVTEVEQIVLGPVDGQELPAADLERVSAGDLAPDFTAMSSTGEAITLSQYRGAKNVVLFFYRGHW